MRFYLIAIACFSLFVVGMATVRHQAETIRLGYRLHVLDRELRELRDDCRQYSLGVESLRSPRRVLAYARSHALNPPADGQVRILERARSEREWLERWLRQRERERLRAAENRRS